MSESANFNFREANLPEIAKMAEDQEVEKMRELISAKMSEWENFPLNVAITGASGVGKSSFINAIRCLCGGDTGAAAVGVVETTSEPTAYKHPTNPNLVFWDLPGAGTPRFPKHTYLSQVGFQRYDFFLLLSCHRFTELDLWLAGEVEKKGKKFFYIRTKIDSDLDNAQKAHRKTFNRNVTMKKIRDDCISNVTKICSHLEISDKIFLISNYDTDKYDFPRLQEVLINSLSGIKRDVMILSLNALSEQAIKAKKQVLESRVWKIATASAFGAIIPIPGTSIAVDIALILTESSFYQKQFGLDKESLKVLKKKKGSTIEAAMRSLQLSQARFITKEGIIQLMKRFAVQIGTKEVLKYIPILGSIAAGGLSYTVTYEILMNIIQEMEADALKLLKSSLEADI